MAFTLPSQKTATASARASRKIKQVMKQDKATGMDYLTHEGALT